MEQKIKEKIFYCICGFREFAVQEKYISTQIDFMICAEKVFAINVVVSPVTSPSKSPVLSVNITPMRNIRMACSFICELLDEDPIYKAIIDMEIKSN